MSWLRKIANCDDPASLAFKMRRRRFAFFRGLLNQLPPPVTILDVGGTEHYWQGMGFGESENVRITLLNVEAQPVRFKNIISVAGDGRHMPQFRDRSFDVVYSNSVIEHVGTLDDQKQMANEVQRIGKRFFVQTPNKYFPIEPHFLFPFFQFLPRNLQVYIASHYRAGWACHPGDTAAARREVESIRLLSAQEVTGLFPDAQIYRERFGGLTKSIIAFGGWQTA